MDKEGSSPPPPGSGRGVMLPNDLSSVEVMNDGALPPPPTHLHGAIPPPPTHLHGLLLNNETQGQFCLSFLCPRPFKYYDSKCER
jgi:hypothetical protein